MTDFDVAGQHDIQVKMILTLHDSPLFSNLNIHEPWIGIRDKMISF